MKLLLKEGVIEERAMRKSGKLAIRKPAMVDPNGAGRSSKVADKREVGV